MSYYQQEISRIRKAVFNNQGQIDAVIAIKNFIDSNYENDLNLDLLSKIQLISKYHLIRLFKKYYGQTPRQYLIDTRIRRSKDQLKKGDTVTEVCFAVGFESLGSFSSLFKARTGQTPSQFRKEQLSRSK